MNTKIKKYERGITLIALVITILVLLILAGVSIAMLTGDNGILTKATEAKNKNEESNAKEKIIVEVLGSYGKDGKPQIEDINKNISNIGGVIKGDKFPLSVTLDNYEFKIKSNGQVVLPEELEWNGTVNAPRLAEGMIPIKWENNNWIICSEDDPEWFEYVKQESGVYKTSRWANVMLSDGKKYKAGSIETENARKNKTPIAEDELGSMFVWIPRYAYQIENLYHVNSSTNGGTINIEFLVGTKKYNIGEQIKSGKLMNTSGEGNWNEHPAFNYGGKILPGIWVAKFEASSTTSTPDENYGGGDTTELSIKVLPGKQSWRGLQLKNIFTNCINMNNENNIYGISTNDDEIDPHLIKNSEWGAVAYLAQSSYGKNGNQVIANSNGYDSYKYIYTGYAGEGGSAGNPIDGVTSPTNVYYYNTSKGMLASTTGNITGVYDMCGGTWEVVAGYINNGHSNMINGQTLIEANEKYKNIYKAIKVDGSEATKGNDDRLKNYEATKNIYGDAIWETSASALEGSAWYSDTSYYPNTVSPFFIRGGSYFNADGAGVFSFYFYNGIRYSK